MSSQPDDQLEKRIFDQGRWPHKTVDIGANGVTVSANPLGQIYQISCPLNAANEFGIMVAAPWPQFDHTQRTNPTYVRQFREIPEALLAQNATGLGLDFPWPNLTGSESGVIRPVRGSVGSHLQFEYLFGDILVQTALKVHDHGTIVHANKVTNLNNKVEHMIPVTLDLAFAVSRAGYGQLTDRGEVDMPDPANVLESCKGANGSGLLAVENRSLGGRVIAHIIFYNETTQEYIEVQDALYAQRGEQQNPPHRPSNIPIQEIRLGPCETLKLVVSFRPEDIRSSDQFASMPEAIQADAIAPDVLFSHRDGTSDCQEIGHRLLEEVHGPDRDAETLERTILWANVNYILGCCCVPMRHPKGDATCCIADHFALNLGWPRGNYWQMRLLRKLDWTKLTELLPDDDETASRYYLKIRQALKNHLTWLFQMAVTQIEIDGETRHFWRRSYLVNGLPKDGEVFQLDTQCYPFLELCEYFEAYGHEPETGSVIASILQTDSFENILWDLLSRRDAVMDLFSSDETPADDDLGDYKFHLSSNILLWHTLCKLSKLLSHPRFEILAPEAIDGEALRSLAGKVRQSILRNFTSIHIVTARDGQRIERKILAYGLDPTKYLDDPMRCRHYHDGNDMPTLYAQEWGFLKNKVDDQHDDPDLRKLWENTMVWAFTPGDADAGFNSGYIGSGSERFHGLGSDHSPGPWTLGFFQEWKFAQMVGDMRRESKAWEQIEGSAQFDGTFSEAVDIDTGVCTSKPWFSWPGAMIAENLIDTVIEQVQQDAVDTGEIVTQSSWGLSRFLHV